MDYGDRPVHAIEIIPDPTAVCSEFIPSSFDQSIWATEDDYRSWNGDPSTDFMSNQSNDGRQPNSKKPRTSSQGDSAPSKSKLLGRMFFKTKLCCRFRAGTCPYITNCNFAHGMEELRKPPPNWQEIVAANEDGAPVEAREERQIPVMTTSPVSLVDGQRLYKGRHCRRFFTDEGCPYGETCGYTHEDPLMRESVTISLSPTFGGGCNMVGGNGLIQKPSNWKTRICNKWEMTGYCPFGNKCHFAHGSAELHRVGGGLVETDGRDVWAATADSKPAGAFAKTTNDAVAASGVSVAHGDAYHGGRSAMASQRPIQRPAHNWKGPDKISRIYGDWIDDNE